MDRFVIKAAAADIKQKSLVSDPFHIYLKKHSQDVGISNNSIEGTRAAPTIICSGLATLTFDNISFVQMSSLQIESCGVKMSSTPSAVSVRFVGKADISLLSVRYSQVNAITVVNSTVIITNSTLSDNNGTGLILVNNSMAVLIGDCAITLNMRGGIKSIESNLILIGHITFIHNRATCGGAVYSLDSTVTSTSMANVRFVNNTASLHGGGIYTKFGRINLTGVVVFFNNTAQVAGGAIMQVKEDGWNTSQSTSTEGINVVYSHRPLCSAVYVGSIFMNGTVFFANNTAMWGGAIHVSSLVSISLNGYLSFHNNSATIGGGIYVQCITTIVFNASMYLSNNKAKMGGAINLYKVNSCLLKGQYNLENNCALNGGAIVVFYTKLIASCKSSVVITTNKADSQGGGLFLYQSKLLVNSHHFSLHQNIAGASGGGLYAQGSNITLNTTVMIDSNDALLGGGGYLTVQSYLFLSTLTCVYFVNNTAGSQGGALKVHDEDYSETCMVSSIDYFDNACFYQPITNIFDSLLQFSNNTAREAGNVLYGGGIDNCHDLNVSRRLDFTSVSSFEEGVNGISDISSDAFKVCYCTNHGEKMCSERFKPMNTLVYPGQPFEISLVTVGQWNGTNPTSLVAFVDQHSNAHLNPSQTIQQTNSSCSKYTYTIFSNNKSVDIHLTVGDKCFAVARHAFTFRVKLLPCPNGFQIARGEHLPECTCDTRLRPYADDCTIDNQLIHRTTNYFWVKYDAMYKGLVIHPHCPLGYCMPPPVNFSLVNESESDKQCSNKRTGLLCGQCPKGLSAVLGTSRCYPCSNYYLLLISAFAFTGLVLVVAVFMLRTTVAVGTFSGIIFYCNFVHINQTLYFPEGEANIFKVFVSWMNSDVGIETCFFNGMDMYVKTWLQFTYPLYICIICGLLIFASKKSFFSWVLGSNPVAVLATLFLGSYTKILRTCIAVITATTLAYPDGHSETVWLYDANIRYLRGKHIPLFIVGIVLLILSVPYNVLLLTSEALRAHSNTRILSWMNSPRVIYFVDAHNAPFKKGHAYWTGLLLFVRTLLMLITATNVSGDLHIVHLLNCSIAVALVIIAWAVGGPYNSRYLNCLEATSILNMNILSLGTLYIYSYHVSEKSSYAHNQVILTFVSVGLCMMLFAVVLVYHICIQIKRCHLYTKLRMILTQNVEEITSEVEPDSCSSSEDDMSYSDGNNPGPEHSHDHFPHDSFQPLLIEPNNSCRDVPAVYQQNYLSGERDDRDSDTECDHYRWCLVSEPHLIELREPVLEFT